MQKTNTVSIRSMSVTAAGEEEDSA